MSDYRIFLNQPSVKHHDLPPRHSSRYDRLINATLQALNQLLLLFSGICPDVLGDFSILALQFSQELPRLVLGRTGLLSIDLTTFTLCGDLQLFELNVVLSKG